MFESSGGQAVSRSPSLTMMLPADVWALLCSCGESWSSKLEEIKVKEYQSKATSGRTCDGETIKERANMNNIYNLQ